MPGRAENVSELTVSLRQTVRDTIACIDRNVRGIALVADEHGRLLATVTDGDIRRAILAGISLDSLVSNLIEAKYKISPTLAISVPEGTPDIELLQLMRSRSVRQIPVVDATGRVVHLATLEDMIPDATAGVSAMIMAGGAGQRLRPLTLETPKPMLPVGDRPILELILERLRFSGIRSMRIATHYKPEKIKGYFGDGSRLGLDIQYVDEQLPLGTAGALSRLEDWTEPLLVLNGDVLTRLNFKEMLRFHHECGAYLTMAVRGYETQVPYGVVECEGIHVRKIVEKPKLNYFINAGVYLLNPEVKQCIPDCQRFDMTDLISNLIKGNKPVASFPVHEYWLDIGQPADYARAQGDASQGMWM
jgi:dTDP-glucose pyrophosphorylase/CBS domain-containing protein